MNVMTQRGRKVAVVDFGFDATYTGLVEWVFGWKRLLEPIGWQFDFFYVDEKFNNLEAGDSKFPAPVQKWTDPAQVEGYDFLLFNCMGRGTVRHSTDALVDMVLRVKNPITVYVDHQRAPVRHTFRNFERKPQYVYAFDYVFTCNSLKMYEKGGVPAQKVRPVELFHSWKSKMEGVDPRPFEKRDIDVLYAARMTGWKGIYEMLKFLETIHGRRPGASFEMYGWTGTIGEVQFKDHPYMILDFWKGAKFHKNSPEAFIPFHPFVFDQRKVYEVLARSVCSWNAIRFGKNPEERWINPAFEGSGLTAIRMHSIPILNGISRKLDVRGTPLEQFGAFFFVDDANVDKLVEDYFSADLNRMHENLVEFEKAFFDEDHFRKSFVDRFEEFLSLGHQPRCKPSETKFNQIDGKRNIWEEHGVA